MKLLLSVLAAIVAGISQAVVFSNNTPKVIPVTTSTNHSGMTGQVSSGIFLGQTGMNIGQIESLTITGLSHGHLGSLYIYLYTPGANVSMFVPNGQTAAVNGDITFRVAPGLTTINQAAASTSTIGNGSYLPSISTPSLQVVPGSFNRFAGLSASGNMSIIILNYSRTVPGSFSGWSVNMSLTPVPEPASLFALSLGLVALARKRK